MVGQRPETEVTVGRRIAPGSRKRRRRTTAVWVCKKAPGDDKPTDADVTFHASSCVRHRPNCSSG